MRSIEDMAHEYAVEILKTVHANHGHLSEFELENIAETAFGLAQAMQTELSKLNRGVPDAILEADRLKCEHCWVDATVDGSVRDCIKCGQRREEG
ncbi:hypothetical protein [Acinetobacter radioresistens]|uniref:hypothetical protein n=1 Tax=Acinetobacter radioresistens TaxID=40216 RepID=UPI0032136DBB